MLVSKAALLGGAILAAALVSACSAGNTNTTGGAGGSTGGTGGSTTTTTTTATTTSSTTGSSGSLATDPPQVVNNGGTVISAPKVQLIVYAEDPDAADAQAFLEEFASTPTWAAQASEYGVGPLTVLPPIMIAGTPPATLEDNLNGNITPFEQTLVTNITGSSPAWGAADANTIYMFQLPKGTNIKSDGSCCSAYLGYHYETTAGSINVPYAVSCNCGLIQGAPLTALQWVTTTLSHEVVEAATDPFPSSSLAWSGTDADHLAWTNATGGEVADMCEYNADSNYIPPNATYMVQRSWSNKAAKAGQNPCVPVPPTGPYFNAVPVLTDSVQMATEFGTTSPTKGVTIPIGQTKTIDIDIEAAGAISGPVTVTVLDFNYFNTGSNPDLEVSFGGTPTSGKASTTGSAGDVLHLTIKSLKADARDISALFVVIADHGTGSDLQENMSFGAVGQ